MRGREPAAFNFIDLTQCGDGGNTDIGSTSAAGAAHATMALLSPKVQQDDDARRAMPPPPARPEQAHIMLSSSSTANRNNNNNNGAFFRRPDQTFLRPDQTFLRPDQTFLRPDQGISEDHCRAYLDRQDGGRSAARQRRRLERPRPVQPAPDHMSSLQINMNDIAGKHPTDVHDQVKPDHTQMQRLGNHLTLASTSNQQADAEIDRMKWAQKEEASRQKHLMAIKEQEQAAALLQQRQAAMLQERQAAILQAAWQQQAAARNMNPGGHNIVHTQNPDYGQAPPPPPPPPQPGLRPLLPRPSPPTNCDPMANNMKQGSFTTAVPGSMNGMAQQRQQHIPPPNSMRGEGSRLAMHHCELTSRMTIFYASMVNVFDDVSFEMAQAVCMMLSGKESKLWPPTRINHHLIGPGPEPSLISQPALIPQQINVPSAPQSSHQAGPSQATVSTEKLPQARKASLTRFLERRRERIRSKGNVKEEVEEEEEEEEEDTTVASVPDPRGKQAVSNVNIPTPSEYQPSSSADRKVVPTHVASDPTTPPGASSSSSKRKCAHDHDLYMRGQSGEYATVKEDAATPPVTTTVDYVMREYQAVLKEFNP